LREKRPTNFALRRVIDNRLPTSFESGKANTYETRRAGGGGGGGGGGLEGRRPPSGVLSQRTGRERLSVLHAPPLQEGFIPPPPPPPPPPPASCSRDNASLTTDCVRGMSRPIRNFLPRLRLGIIRDNLNLRRLPSLPPSLRPPVLLLLLLLLLLLQPDRASGDLLYRSRLIPRDSAYSRRLILLERDLRSRADESGCKADLTRNARDVKGKSQNPRATEFDNDAKSAIGARR